MSAVNRVLGVRARLAILVLGCVIPMATAAGFLLADYYQRGRQQLVNSTLTRAQAMAAELDREFDHNAAALQALATSRELHDGELAAFHTRATEALANLRADSLVLVGLDGSLALSTRRSYGSPLPKLPRTPLLAKILATGKPGESALFPGPLAGKLIYTVGVPVRRDGQIVMTLNATAAPEQLDALLAAQQLPGSWRAGILDSQGKIAVRSHDSAHYVGKEATPALMQHIAQASDGGFEAHTLDGIPVYTVYSTAPRSRWVVAMGIPLDELTGALRHALAWLVAGTVAALALGLALAWRMGDAIAGSVQALMEPARAVGQGQLPVIPLQPLREANELRQALLDAAQQLRSAQASAQESADRLALAAESAELGLWVRDLEHNQVWASPLWRKLFGFQMEETVTVHAVMQRVHPDDRASAGAVLTAPRQRYHTEFRLLLADGNLRWISSRGSVEAGSGGQPRLVRGVSLDISERKQAELAILQKQQEVTHLSRVAMLGELSGALAHELNQPLTAILSNAQAAQRFLRAPQPALDEVTEILADIVAADRRAGDIIRRLRSLFGKKDTQQHPILASALATEVAALLRNDFINRGVALRLDVQVADAEVLADRVQVQQVLINLLVNACDAMAGCAPGTANVTLHCRRESDGMLGFVVSDCGPGIADGQLERIFDPFFSTKEHGMGLGLSICRNIATAHGGKLWAANLASGGAAFHLTLPEAA
ncbi:PAS domain-containing sensor histidine kinase [Duganella sp. Root198D2]|nr:PAS domain-containing sensor histidine kinase [Duganella sp. Root198D2]